MDNEPITDSELRNLRALSTHFYNQDRGKTAFWHMPKLLDEIERLRGALEDVPTKASVRTGMTNEDRAAVRTAYRPFMDALLGRQSSISEKEWAAAVDRVFPKSVSDGDDEDDTVAVPRRILSRLGVVAARMYHRVDAIIERDGSPADAVTGPGIGIGYLLATEIANACQAAADVLNQAPSPRRPVPGEPDDLPF